VPVPILENKLRFKTADTGYRGRRPPAERAPRHTKIPILTQQMAPAPLKVVARVNHGRWIVDCPFCTGAQLASPTDRRFLCADCGNVNIDGKWITVTWPSDAETIEATLAVRPRENRNWRPDESIADLRRENVEHDLPEAVA
jgi:hypothetical protein